jgi:hypothetical protein
MVSENKNFIVLRKDDKTLRDIYIFLNKAKAAGGFC